MPLPPTTTTSASAASSTAKGERVAANLPHVEGLPLNTEHKLNYKSIFSLFKSLLNTFLLFYRYTVADNNLNNAVDVDDTTVAT